MGNSKKNKKIVLKKNDKVFDKKTSMRGFVFTANPLIIELENGQHVPREKKDLMLYLDIDKEY